MDEWQETCVPGRHLRFPCVRLPGLCRARAGALPVDVGCLLGEFVEDLCGTWQAGGCDVAVWMHAEGVCRLGAVLRTAPGGAPLVTWL